MRVLLAGVGIAVSVGLWHTLPSSDLSKNNSSPPAAAVAQTQSKNQPQAASAHSGASSPRVVYTGPIVASGGSAAPAAPAPPVVGTSPTGVPISSPPATPPALLTGAPPATPLLPRTVSPSPTPTVQPVAAVASANPSTVAAAAPSTRLINLNTASVEELNKLRGGGMIGRAIIRGRPYTSVEDLLAKRVLSRAAYQRISDQVAAR